MAAGLLDADALYRIALTADQANRDRFEAVRAAVAAGRDTVARKRFLDFLAECETSEVRIRALRYAFSARLLTAGDLAALAAGHRDRKLRRLAATMVLELPDADAVLGRLLAASDGVVRGTAVQRLAAGAVAERLVPYLTDPSPWVRGLADRGLRAAGGDPHGRYRAWCADPEAVTPAAVSGLAEYRDPRDEPLLQTLIRHADGGVRARALGGLRRLGALEDSALARYAADPDPHVVAVVVRGLGDDPALLRAALSHRQPDAAAYGSCGSAVPPDRTARHLPPH
ncbi:HEAT repeat domain-containing protein [Streptomyces sp. NPDC001546]|uniref:HEAT repeat domain-containing protein n=1 Tax=Streptomyces sp. NPDC001546 TaxID=3364585 RepID=UPI0036925846